MSRPYAKGKRPYVVQPRPPLFGGVKTWLGNRAAQVLKLPRFARIFITSLCALALTLAIFPIIDSIYLTYFYSEGTVFVGVVFPIAIGIIFYMLGWRIIVGMVGELPPARPAVFWYIVIGILAAMVVITLLLQGYSILSDTTTL